MSTGTRVRRALLVALFLSASVGAASVSAAAPQLKGVTTITARTTTVVQVTVPRGARFDIGTGFKSEAITVSGRGRVFGFALSRGGDEPVLVSAMVFARCTEPACLPAPPFTQREVVTTAGTRRVNPEGERTGIYELPAGRYYAHVFTDGTPVSVQLRFAGIAGRTRVAATAAHRAFLKNGSETLPASGPAYSAGASAPVSGPLTLMAFLVIQRSQPHVEHIESNCYYHDSTPPGGHVLPTCPGGSQGYLFDIGYVTTDYQSAGYGTRAVSAEGDSWYQGVWVEGVQGPSDFYTTFFWSDLRT